MATIVKSVIGDWVRKKGMRTSATFYDALDKVVVMKVDRAVARAKANGRKTVMDCDL